MKKSLTSKFIRTDLQNINNPHHLMVSQQRKNSTRLKNLTSLNHLKFIQVKPQTSCITKLTKSDKIQRLNILIKLRKINQQYQKAQYSISQQICENIYSILEALTNQDSIYGSQMSAFFKILKQMIFCEQPQILDCITDTMNIQIKKPYGVLIKNVLQEKYQDLVAKETEIQKKIENINLKILTIEQKNIQAMKVQNIQFENQMSALRSNYQKQISRLQNQIQGLKQQFGEKLDKIQKTQHKHHISQIKNLIGGRNLNHIT